MDIWSTLSSSSSSSLASSGGGMVVASASSSSSSSAEEGGEETTEKHEPQGVVKASNNNGDTVVSVFAMGDKSSGKSSLIQRFLDKSQSETKATTALEFTFSRKAKPNSLGKFIVEVFELGSGTKLAPLLQTAMSKRALKNWPVLMLTLDLSSPADVLDTLLFWLGRLAKAVETCVGSMEEEEQEEVRGALEARLMEAYEGNEDADTVFAQGVAPFPVPLLIVGTHYDSFAQLDSDRRKVMCRMLRWFAHAHAASLVFTSLTDESLVARFKSMLGTMVFPGSSNRKAQVTDHSKPLFVHAGTDTFAAIGKLPDKGYASSPSELWRMVFEERFPVEDKRKDEVEDDPLAYLDQFVEAKIDAMRKQKDDELERYKKELERRKRAKMQRAQRSALAKGSKGGKGGKGARKKKTG